MRDIDAMMADIGNLLGDASDDAEKVSGNGDGMPARPAAARRSSGSTAGEPASTANRRIREVRLGDRPGARAATPEDASLIRRAIARGASDPGAVLVASVVCSCVRGAVLRSGETRLETPSHLQLGDPSRRRRARLQLIVPFCVASAADGAAAVRAAAVRALAETTRRVETFPASDAKVFPGVRLAADCPASPGTARRACAWRHARRRAAARASASVPAARRNEGSEDAADGLSMSAAYEDDPAPARALVRGAVLDYLAPGGSCGGGAERRPVAAAPPRAAASAAAAAFARGAADARAPPPPPRGGRGPRPKRRRRAFARAAVRAPTPTSARPTPPPPPRRGPRRPPRFSRRRRARGALRDAASGVGEARRGPLLRGAHARFDVGRVRRAFSQHGGGAAPPSAGTRATPARRRAPPFWRARTRSRRFSAARTRTRLVPLLITCLNDRSWRLRVAFFERIAAVARFVGVASAEAFLLPCVERCLADDSDEVAAAALRWRGHVRSPARRR